MRLTIRPDTVIRPCGALALALAVVAAGGCKRERALRVERRGQAQLQNLGVEGSTVVAHHAASGRLAVGTTRGGILLVEKGGGSRWLLPERRNASSRPASSRPASSRPASSRPASSRPTSRPTASGGPRHLGPLRALRFTGDGRRLLSAGGRSLLFWDVARGRVIGEQLRGPQPITAAALGAGERVAFFGTSRGHVLRWRLGAKAEAELVAGATCGGRQVLRNRLNLPVKQRCPYGTYFADTGGPRVKHVCLYPVTQLSRAGKLLACACRTGDLTLLDLGDRRLRHAAPGALRSLALSGDGKLVAALRGDGELRVLDVGHGGGRARPREIWRRRVGHQPRLVAVSGERLAVATTRRVWLATTAGVVAQRPLELPAAPVWLRLDARAGEATITVVLVDGRLWRQRVVTRVSRRGAS